MELTKEHFERVVGGLATKKDLEDLVTQEGFEQVLSEKLAPLATKQDVRDGAEELARITSAGFERTEERFGLHIRLMTFRLVTEDPTVLLRAHQIVEQSGIQARRWHTHRSDEGSVVEFDADVTYPQERELMEKLAALKVRCDVRPV